MFEDLTVLSMANQKMNWLAQRQEVLAENIANANTPRYLAKDLKPLDFKAVLDGSEAAGTVQLVTTNPRHIATQATDSNEVETETKPYESTPDGNGVVLEEQMDKIGRTKVDYETVTDLFAKQIKMLKLAITGQ
jgi:flagellar basal-body rod protein FlgB